MNPNSLQNKDTFIVGIVTSYFPALSVFVIILTALLAYYFLFIPQINRVRAGGDLHLGKKTELLSRYQSYVAKLQKLEEEFKQIQADPNFAKLNYGLPEKIELPALINQVESLFLANGILVNKLEVGTVAPGEEQKGAAADLGLSLSNGVKKLNVNLNIGAIDYQALKNLLRELEKNVRLFDVVNLTFDPKSESQNITLVTYYFQP